MAFITSIGKRMITSFCAQIKYFRGEQLQFNSELIHLITSNLKKKTNLKEFDFEDICAVFLKILQQTYNQNFQTIVFL